MKTERRALGILSGKSPHLYVTRTATLKYARLMGLGFEEARMRLTETLLSSAWRDDESGIEGAYQFTEPAFLFRAFTRRKGPLLVVTSISYLDQDGNA